MPATKTKNNKRNRAGYTRKTLIGQYFKNGYFKVQGIPTRLIPRCQDCGVTEPERGFAPIFEDNGLVLLCWPCYHGWCEIFDYAAYQDKLVNQAVKDIERGLWKQEKDKTKKLLDAWRQSGFV